MFHERIAKEFSMKSLTFMACVLACGGLLSAQGGGATSAAQKGEHHEHFLQCAKACGDCQIACDSCFKHCAKLLEEGKTDHVKTMYACVDCAEFCSLSAKLTARQSPLSTQACEGCAKACDLCAAECEKFKSDKHMTDCAKSCRDCAKSCRTMIEHLKR
jgi:hypothetical protein